MIYAQTITDVNGAVYKFGSSSFKWVYDQAIHLQSICYTKILARKLSDITAVMVHILVL